MLKEKYNNYTHQFGMFSYLDISLDVFYREAILIENGESYLNIEIKELMKMYLQVVF